MNTDKELQHQEEFEATPLSAEDKRVYALLMAELDKEPEISIPSSFSANVLKSIMAKRKKEARSEALLFGSAIGGVILMVIFMMSFITSAITEVPNIFQNSPLLPVIALVAMLIIFQVLDKKHFADRRLKNRLKQRQ